MKNLSSTKRTPYVLCLTAVDSGAGKTTLIEKLIVSLKNKGYRMGALKHSSHPVQMDWPGKDSFRSAAAGAGQVAVVSDETVAMFRTLGKPINSEQIPALFENVDIVLVEGFKSSQYPKIEVHRACMGKSLLYPGRDALNIIAIASDERLLVDCTLLDLQDTESIAAWIAAQAEQFFRMSFASRLELSS